MKRLGIAVTVTLAGITTGVAAAEDAVLNNSVGICEIALRQGNPDVGSLAETFGFSSTNMSDGSPAWQHEAGSERTLIASSAGVCAVVLYRGNYTSGATEAFQSWARTYKISFSAVTNGDKYGENAGITFRYRELPQNGSGALIMSRQ